jgi:hypothetical protein
LRKWGAVLVVLLLVLGICGYTWLMDAGKANPYATPVSMSVILVTDKPDLARDSVPALESEVITTSEGEEISVPGVAYLDGEHPDVDVKGIMLVIPIWDGVPHTEVVCELDHGTEVEVLAAQWAESEERYYLKVESEGCEGWVRDLFVSSECHE